MTSNTPAGSVDDEIRQLYKRYQAAESDAERREIALDRQRAQKSGRRHGLCGSSGTTTGGTPSRGPLWPQRIAHRPARCHRGVVVTPAPSTRSECRCAGRSLFRHIIQSLLNTEDSPSGSDRRLLLVDVDNSLLGIPACDDCRSVRGRYRIAELLGRIGHLKYIPRGSFVLDG